MHLNKNSITNLKNFIESHKKIMVLTGAGVSSDSGIGTYRDHEGKWLVKKPMHHNDFITNTNVRKRYWTRSFFGWPTIQNAKPNITHHALVNLERQGKLENVVTQNVDRLHQKAGHTQVIDLHGRLDRVFCLDCDKRQLRSDVQTRLLIDNPHLLDINSISRPDGDALVEESISANTISPSCINCGGVLMPEVIFFGGTIPKNIVSAAMGCLEKADALLVLGSSLTVFSGYRFCRQAQLQDKPIIAINKGWTRADDMYHFKIQENCSDVFRELNKGFI